GGTPQVVAGPYRRRPLGQLNDEHGGRQARASGAQGVVGSGVAASGRTQVDAAAAGQPVGGGGAADQVPDHQGRRDHACSSSHAAPAGQNRTNSQERQAAEGRGSN